MADPTAADSDLWQAFWFGLGGVIAVMGGGFLYIMGQFREVEKKFTAKEEAADAAGLRIWGKLDQQSKDSILLAIEQRFATRDYLMEQLRNMELRMSADQRAMFREHENNVRTDIDMRLGHRNGDAG